MITDPETEMITTSLKPELLMTTEFITTPEGPEFQIREETNSIKQDTTSFPDSVTELITTSVEGKLLVATEVDSSVATNSFPSTEVVINSVTESGNEVVSCFIEVVIISVSGSVIILMSGLTEVTSFFIVNSG